MQIWVEPWSPFSSCPSSLTLWLSGRASLVAGVAVLVTLRVQPSSCFSPVSIFFWPIHQAGTLVLTLVRLVVFISFLPGLFSAGGMGLWHGVEFYETEKLVGEREFLRPKVHTVSTIFLSYFFISALQELYSERLTRDLIVHVNSKKPLRPSIFSPYTNRNDLIDSLELFFFFVITMIWSFFFSFHQVENGHYLPIVD